MNHFAVVFGASLAVLGLAMPVGFLAGAIGRNGWLRFGVVAAVGITIMTGLFVNPTHRSLDDTVATALSQGSAVLIDGFLVRAALRAMSRRRAARKARLAERSAAAAQAGEAGVARPAVRL